MALLAPEDRVDPENLQLYSANLEANSANYFEPVSNLELGYENETQNFQAVKASELKDHLLQMISQKEGITGIDDITSITTTGNSMPEIQTEKEKEESLIEHAQAFRDKQVNNTELLTKAKSKAEKSTKKKDGETYQSIMEQDGLYVPKAIKITNRNIERITNRLQWSEVDRERFFDNEGHLKNDAPALRKIPPPFKQDPIYPPYYNSGKSQLLPATVWGLENSATARDIRVEVNSIQFTVHHLSSDEDVLAIRMKQLYVSYLHAVQYPRSNYFASRIKALRRDLKIHPENRLKILEEIIDCHKMKDTEELSTRMKLEQLLVTWHELKDVRTKNGFNTTTPALRWQSKKFSEEQAAEEQAKFDKAALKRAKEVVELAALRNEEENADIEQTVEEIKQNHKDMGLRMPGDPIWRPVIYDIELSPDDKLSAEEHARQHKIERARIYVAFMMGTTEMRSNDTLLNKQFLSPIDTGCKASTMRVPNDVRIHIYEYGDQHLGEIATVPIPVLNGVPKEFISYEFAAESKTKSGLIVQGYVTARVFIEPDTVATQTVLPQVRSVAPTRVQVSNRFISVPKYLEIVAKHDPNDPYIAAAVGSVMAESNEQTIYNRFAIDVAKDSTKFESMAPSNLCEVIHKKAYDKLYGDSGKAPITEEPKLQLADVVREAPTPTFSNFFSALWKFMTFRRGKDKVLDRSAPAHRLESYSKVILCITGFSNLPQEVTTANARIKFDGEEVETKMWDVRSQQFLGAHNDFEQKGCCSRKKVDEKQPIIGMSFTFTIAKGDSVPHFSQIEDKTVRIDVFDSVEERFLAAIEVPLRSVFVNGKIEGEYSLFCAPFNLGYTSAEQPMRIKMSLELTPQLLPPNFVDQNACSEKPQISKRAQKITEHFQGSRRRIVPLATTISNSTVLACRFITPQNPPEGLHEIPELLSFVSILPTTKDSAMPGAENQKWSTSQQFLNDARGTNTEHAILLCNFLKHLEQDAYVILGHDAITGLCAFVGIRQGPNKMQILDPCAGREVEEKSFSTLLDIGTVFNDRNIWFNQQKIGKVEGINWNLNDSGKWLAFFCRDFPRCELTSPQESQLEFEESPIEHLEALQRHVESVLMTTTENLRGERATNWDDEYSEKLSRVLSTASKGNADKLRKRLSEVTKGKGKTKLIGSPFFIAYVYDEDNIEKLRTEIAEELKSRQEFDCNKRGVKFASAVHVISYPNDVYGIWFLLAAIVPSK